MAAVLQHGLPQVAEMRDQLTLAMFGWKLLVAPHSPVQCDRIHVAHRRADSCGGISWELIQPASGPQARSGQTIQCVDCTVAEQTGLDRVLHQEHTSSPASSHRWVVEDRPLALCSRSRTRFRGIDSQPAQRTPLAVKHTGPAFGLWRFHAGPRSLLHKVLTTVQTTQ